MSWTSVLRSFNYIVFDSLDQLEKNSSLSDFTIEIVPIIEEDQIGTKYYCPYFHNKYLFQRFCENNNLLSYVPKIYTKENYSFPLIVKESISAGGQGCKLFNEYHPELDYYFYKNCYCIQEYINFNRIEYSTYCVVKNGIIIKSLTYKTKLKKGSLIKNNTNLKYRKRVFTNINWIEIFSLFFKAVNYWGFATIDHTKEGIIFEINCRIGAGVFQFKRDLEELLKASEQLG